MRTYNTALTTLHGEAKNNDASVSESVSYKPVLECQACLELGGDIVIDSHMPCCFVRTINAF